MAISGVCCDAILGLKNVRESTRMKSFLECSRTTHTFCINTCTFAPFMINQTVPTFSLLNSVCVGKLEVLLSHYQKLGSCSLDAAFDGS